MLAAIWSAAHHPSRWQISLRALSQSEQRSYSALSLPFRSLSQANSVDAAPAVPVKDPNVFEDQSSSDYAIVARASIPPPPSTLSLVEEKLPKWLLQPLPGDVIFEDASLDADYIASAPTHATHNPSSIFHTLSNLVQAGNYEEAWNVLKEIQTSELSIPFSPIYEAAAQAVLAESTLEPPQLASRFVSWFSLIPLAHQTTKRRKFLRTRSLVFRSSSANPDIATQAALILASKGYASHVTAEAIPFIMRYASPNLSLDFVVALERANEAYWSTYNPQLLNHTSKAFTRNVRGAAIKSLANSGHLEAAVALLPNGNEMRFRLTARTYDVLLGALRSAPDSPSFAHIPLVEALRRHHAIRSKVEKRDDAVHQLQIHSFAAELDSQSSEYIGEDLARSLRRLADALQNRSNLPRLGAITNFIEDYVDTGRAGAIATLRRLALNAHPRCASHFLLAEMAYYKSQGLSQLILRLFTDYFYLSGVPRDEILDQCHVDSNESHESAHTASDIQAMYINHSQPVFKSKLSIKTPQNRRKLYDRLRLGKYNDQYRQKLWPTCAHRNLVWNALLSLTQSDEAAEELYGKLLKFASRQGTSHDPLTNKPLSYLQPSARRARVVDTEAFTPFLTRLLSESNPTRGAHILSDLTQVGIIPSIHHFTQVAGFYSRMGNARHAFLVLDMLESQHPLKEEAEVEKGGPVRYVRHPTDALPRPDLPLYTSVMRGFLMRKSVADAQAVEARLRRRFVYVHGQHPPLDRVLADLRRLQRETEAVTVAYGP